MERSFGIGVSIKKMCEPVKFSLSFSSLFLEEKTKGNALIFSIAVSFPFFSFIFSMSSKRKVSQVTEWELLFFSLFICKQKSCNTHKTQIGASDLQKERKNKCTKE